MQRIVRVVEQNGVEYEVPMTAEQAAFFLLLAELKAPDDIMKTFRELIVSREDMISESQSARLN